MHRFSTLFLVSCALFLATSPAFAMHWVDTSGLRYPGAAPQGYDEPVQSYPMNYADEAVQSLGIRNGHMDVFEMQPVHSDSVAPALSGGIGSDGAMLKLQWHPGE